MALATAAVAPPASSLANLSPKAAEAVNLELLLPSWILDRLLVEWVLGDSLDEVSGLWMCAALGGKLGDDVEALEERDEAEQPAAVPPGAVTCFHVFPDGSDTLTPVLTTTDRSSAVKEKTLALFLF